MENSKSKSKQSLIRKVMFILKYVGLPTIILGIIYGFFSGLFLDLAKPYINPPPKVNYVAVFMTRSGGDTYISDEFVNAIGENKSIHINGKAIPIRIINDFGTPEQARSAAKELVNDEHCLIIIGNSSTSLSKVTLEVIVERKSRPVFIMPIATNPELSDIANRGEYRGLLRMPPTDDKQANLICEYIHTKFPRGCVVLLGSTENPHYSEYLLREMSENLHKLGISILAAAYLGPDSAQSPVVLKKYHDLGADCIVYAGMAQYGLILLSQIHALGIEMPIIFTDGCFVSKFISSKSGLQNGRLVSFQSPPMVNGKRNNTGIAAGYKDYASDSIHLARQILDETRKRLKQDTEFSRDNVYSVVDGAKEILTFTGKLGSYSFDSKGNNEKATFHLYRIDKNGTKHDTECPCSKP